MKKTIITMLLMGAALSGFAQKMTEPEFIGQVDIINQDSTLAQVETEETHLSAKSNGMFWIPGAGAFLGKGQSWLIVNGAKSKTELPGTEVSLLVRVKDNNENPHKVVGIIKFEGKKKQRRYLMAESGLVTGTNAKHAYNDVKFDVRKFGKASYIIKATELEPGEYGVIVGEDIARLATFTVK